MQRIKHRSYWWPCRSFLHFFVSKKLLFRSSRNPNFEPVFVKLYSSFIKQLICRKKSAWIRNSAVCTSEETYIKYHVDKFRQLNAKKISSSTSCQILRLKLPVVTSSYCFSKRICTRNRPQKNLSNFSLKFKRLRGEVKVKSFNFVFHSSPIFHL